MNKAKKKKLITLKDAQGDTMAEWPNYKCILSNSGKVNYRDVEKEDSLWNDWGAALRIQGQLIISKLVT